MKWLKSVVRWAYEQGLPDGAMLGGDVQMLKQAPPTPVGDVLRHMSSSIATIYRIDNGFIMSINMNSEGHYDRGACIYAKDAGELAEKIIAHETAFKIGVRNSGAGVQADTAKYSTASIFPNRI
jgi:hypothetical protein